MLLHVPCFSISHIFLVCHIDWVDGYIKKRARSRTQTLLEFSLESTNPYDVITV